jgi:hypothetical protein
VGPSLARRPPHDFGRAPRLAQRPCARQRPQQRWRGGRPTIAGDPLRWRPTAAACPARTLWWDPPLRALRWDPPLRALRWDPPLRALRWDPPQWALRWDPPLRALRWDPPLRALRWDPPLRALRWDPPLRALRWDPPQWALRWDPPPRWPRWALRWDLPLWAQRWEAPQWALRGRGGLGAPELVAGEGEHVDFEPGAEGDGGLFSGEAEVGDDLVALAAADP